MNSTRTPLSAFIAEDEPPARERLIGALARIAPEVTVVGHADSVKGTQAWLASHAAPDLLLLDVQLADGLSLELFRDGTLALPTIFTTAYDRFAIDAFRALAIDYLLKPVNEEALAQALAKVQRLRQAFGADVVAALMQQLGQGKASRWRQRLVGRKGAQFHALPVARIAYVISLDKLAFAVDQAGERYLLETPLAELETELDPAQFFRANRQLLVAAGAVARFTPVGKGRLKVELRPALAGDAVVSQERAAAFKAWLGG
jgi:DNA-binding LytR/AlgR family response regulator